MYCLHLLRVFFFISSADVHTLVECDGDDDDDDDDDDDGGVDGCGKC